MTTNPEMVDRIYESAFVPECWPDMLGELAKIATARAGWIAVSNGPISFYTGSTERMREFLRVAPKDVITGSERWRRGHAAKHAGFIVERDIFTDEELQNDPFYRDVIYPIGLGHAAATTFHLPTGDDLLLSLEREFVLGPVEREAIDRLDQLRPHIARALLMAARLKLEHARAASATMAALGLPALVIDDNGKVLAANDLVEALAGFVEWRAHDRVSLKDREADRLFAEALSRMRGADDAGVRSFPLRGIETQAAMIAHVVPVRLSARDIFAGSDAVLVITPMTAPNAPPVELLQSLFDLTPAEARVARRLAEGRSVEDIAAKDGVSSNTVRSHVARVLEKTGCGRQAAAVALLSGIAMPPR